MTEILHYSIDLCVGWVPLLVHFAMHGLKLALRFKSAVQFVRKLA